MQRITQRQMEKFWLKVDKTGSCWVYQAKPNRDGYIRIHLRLSDQESLILKSHRLAWYLTKGDINKGLFVLHRCDNRKCCNPDHLFLGTQKDNMDDMHAKNRGVQCFKNQSVQEFALRKSKSPEALAKRKETFKKIKHQQGERNSNFGSFWVTNGKESMKWREENGVIPDGFYRGRKM